MGGRRGWGQAVLAEREQRRHGVPLSGGNSGAGGVISAVFSVLIVLSLFTYVGKMLVFLLQCKLGF